MRCLELYCGIGGFASAARRLGWDVELAYDIDLRAVETYALNFSPVARVKTIESLRPAVLGNLKADLWWMSPPCQPYTPRGKQRDLLDYRTGSFLHLLRAIDEVRPPHIALENVPAFGSSESCRRLREALTRSGYHWLEVLLCPSEFGIPNRRKRFYLVASRAGLPRLPSLSERHASVCVKDLLDHDVPSEMWLSCNTLRRFAGALHVVEPDEPGAITNCFTSGYGRAITHAGSYVAQAGRVRLFTPAEILRLLRFDEEFRLPDKLPFRPAWKLVGNSLSIPVVCHVLRSLVDPNLVDVNLSMP